MAVTSLTKEFLSGGSTGIELGTSATAIHTSSASAKDEVWIYASNTSDSAVTVSIVIAGYSRIILTIPAKVGMVQIMPGFIFTSSTVIQGIASAATSIYVYGWVNRIV